MIDRQYAIARKKNQDRLAVNSRLPEWSVMGREFSDIMESSRNLRRNSSIVAAIESCCVGYIAGNGFTATSEALYKDSWDSWAESCGVGGESLDAVCSTIVVETIHGDCLLLVTGEEPKLQVIAGYAIRNPLGVIDGQKDAAGRVCVNGIAGYPSAVGYWISGIDGYRFVNRYDDNGNEVAILIQRHGSTGAGMARSLPIYANAANVLVDVEELLAASVESAKTRAGMTIVATSDPSGTRKALTSDVVEKKDETGEPEIIAVEQGNLVIAPEGTSVTAVYPQGQTECDVAIKRAMMLGASSVGIPHSLVFRSADDINFSASKTLYDEAWRVFGPWTRVISSALTKVWSSYCTQYFGTVPRVRFIGANPMPDTDPSRNSEAEERRMKNGLATATSYLSLKGQDFETVCRQRAEEESMIDKIAKEYGLPPESIRPEGMTMPTKELADAYGVLVRAGVITPNEEDEKAFRKTAGLPNVNDAVTSDWQKEKTRRPITLSSQGAQLEELNNEA